MKNGYIVTTQVRQRWDMSFMHHNYMYRPVGPRIMKRQYVGRLSYDLHGRSPAEGFITIEVARHRFCLPAQRHRCAASNGASPLRVGTSGLLGSVGSTTIRYTPGNAAWPSIATIGSRSGTWQTGGDGNYHSEPVRPSEHRSR